MRFYADLHVHSKYSRACSRDCDLEHLAWWAGRKGIRVVGTGDFTHPAWSEELRNKLVPAEPGFFRLRPELESEVLDRLPPACREPVRFLLSSEISTIYKRDGRTRKVHHLLYAPDLDRAAEITRRLERIGNLASDGRPILGLDSRDLLEVTLESGEGCYLVPAHVWTPWFSTLGSQSGFDAVEDCYGDLSEHVFAVETGLSSDPEMNWRVSRLDRYRLVSNSDAHSPPMLGREATVFDTELDYFSLEGALRSGAGLAGTVEFFPEEGKYHLDGHRSCDVRLSPGETRELDGRCPACGKPLTVGVLHRVEALADRPVGVRPEQAAGYRSLVPLPEIVGEIVGFGPKSKGVAERVNTLVERLGPELGILDDVPLDEVGRAGGSSLLVEALGRLRRGQVHRDAGYDGVYGTIRLFAPDELGAKSGASTLFDLPVAPAAPPAARPAGVGKGSGGVGAAEVGGDAGAAAGDGSKAVPVRQAVGDGPGAEAGDGLAAAPVRQAVGDGPGALAAPVLVGRVGGQRDVPSGPALGGLDDDQRAVVAAEPGPLLVIAGPGAGKTRVLTHLLAHRVREWQVPAGRCLAVTFTRRAAAELQGRLALLLREDAARVLVTTFHGLGLVVVREQHERLGLGPTVTVADQAARVALLQELAPSTPAQACRLAERLSEHKRRRAATQVAGSPTGAPVEPAGGELRERVGVGGSRALGDRGLGDPVDPAGSELGDLLDRYDARLHGRGLVDLDDLITLPVTLLAGDPQLAEVYRDRWEEIAVDEYQDVDELQYRLLRLLSRPHGDLSAIGDPDQSIYGFRGGDVGYFLRFTEDFPAAQVLRLSNNYRSTPTIVRAALGAIQSTTLVPGRALSPRRTDVPDSPVVVRHLADEQEEAEAVAALVEQYLGGTSWLAFDRDGVERTPRHQLSFADFAVLYRTEAQAGPIAEALGRRGFPVQARSHERLGDRPEVQEVVMALRAAGEQPEGPGTVAERVQRAAGLMLAHVRQSGPARSPDVVDERAVRAAVDLLAPLASRCGRDLERFLTELALGVEVDLWDPRADRVSLLTLHASKGLEFPVVFIVGCEDGLLPFRPWPRPHEAGAGSAAPVSRVDEAEERRLFFVGLTRATSQVVLTTAGRRSRWGTIRETVVSPFLADVPPELLERSSVSAARSGRPPVPHRQLRLL